MAVTATTSSSESGVGKPIVYTAEDILYKKFGAKADTDKDNQLTPKELNKFKETSFKNNLDVSFTQAFKTVFKRYNRYQNSGLRSKMSVIMKDILVSGVDPTEAEALSKILGVKSTSTSTSTSASASASAANWVYNEGTKTWEYHG